MPRGDGRLTAGQNIKNAISAAAWNRAQAAADIVLGGANATTQGEQETLRRALNIVLVRNIATQPVPLGGVLQLQDVLVNPYNLELDDESPTAREFVRRPTFLGIKPQNQQGPFAVALEPVRPNAIGRFASGGVFPCKVRFLTQNHTHATCRKNDVSQLVSATCGDVRLLWKAPIAGEYPYDNTWAVGCM